MKLKKKTTDHDHDKYIYTPEFNKLTAEHFSARVAQANVASKNDIANFVKKIDFDNKLKNLNELLKKVNLLLTKDYNFFLGRIYFTSNDGYQNMFIYQPTFDMLELRKNKGTENIIGSEWKGVYNSKLIALHGVLRKNRNRI